MRLALTVLHLLFVNLFSGFATGSQAAILYLYYFYDTGITFTGIVFADWLLLVAFAGTFYYSMSESLKLRHAIKSARKMSEDVKSARQHKKF